MIRVCVLLLLAVVAGLGLLRLAIAESVTPRAATPAALWGTPEVSFVREIPGAVPVSLQIRNDGDESDRLLGGSTPIADRVEVHQTRLIAGQRVMGPVPDGIVAPAGRTVTLEPGSDHLMLLGLRRDLAQGETFPLTLRFARAGEMTVTARVRRKVDAAAVSPVPTVVSGDISVSLASAPPAPAATPAADLAR